MTYGPGEDEPEGTPDEDLLLAIRCVANECLPRAGGLNDQPLEILQLMDLVRSIQNREISKPTKK